MSHAQSDTFDRQRAAEMLAANPLLNLLLEELKADAIRTWKDGSNVAQREEMWWRHKSIEGLEEAIRKVLENAKFEAEKRRRAERREVMA